MDKVAQNIVINKTNNDVQDVIEESKIPSRNQEMSEKLDEFFSAFFDYDETIHLRFLKPKGDDRNTKPKTAEVTRRELKEDSQSINQILKLNEEYGVYFTVNAGGTKKTEIDRFTAVFCEDDERSIDEQIQRYKPFNPSLLIKTKRSVHAYWLLKKGASLEEWSKLQNFLINFFGTDKAIKDESRVMRVPYFDHLQIENGKLHKRQVELIKTDSDLRYSVSELQATFESDLFEEIKNHFTNIQPSGNGFIASCPAHNDSNPSLQISKGDKRNVLVKCFAGCEIEQILSAAQMPPRLQDFIYSEKGNIKSVGEKLNAKNELQFAPMKALDSTLKPVEEIDPDYLPKILTDWLIPASKVIGCPVDFLALSAIVTTGNLIGSRLRVKPLENSNWSVVPNIYAGLVGLPSTKKTPALDETRKPILGLQNKARTEFEAAENDFQIESRFFEKEINAIYKQKLSLEDTKDEIAKLQQSKQPILRRYETNDITVPKLIQFLADNPNGLMLFRDELSGWLRSLDNEYDKSARAFFLELWKGAIAYELSRVDGRELQVKSGTFSIIGGVQPSKLQKYVTEAYSFDNSDGFLQRFMFAYPDVKKQAGKPSKTDYKQMNDGFKEANEILQKIAEFDFKPDVVGANGEFFKAVKFSPNAQTIVDQWKDEIEEEAESIQNDDEPFSSYLYKLPKTCFAVALIFHCLENINSAVFPDEISEETTLKAINYVGVLTSHARRVFALGENQIFSLANILLGKIKKGNLSQGFTKREIERKQWSGLTNSETVNNVLSLLIDYGYLKAIDSTGDGRPTTKYFIHPSLMNEVKDEDELES